MANSILLKFIAMETKKVKDYFHSQLFLQKTASQFIKNFDLDFGLNQFFQSYLI